MSRLRRSSECHPDRKHQAHGMCNKCYSTWHYNKNRQNYLDSGKARYQADPKAYNQRAKSYLHRNPRTALFKAAKSRAHRYGLEFSIDPSDIQIPEVCPVLGIPLIPLSGKFASNSPSIDRIDNSQGYIKGNIVVVSFRANGLKRDATPDELQKLADFYNKRS